MSENEMSYSQQENKTYAVEAYHWIILILLGAYLSVIWYANYEISQIDASQTLTFMNTFRDSSLYPDSFMYKQAYPYHLYSVYYIVLGLIGLIVDPYYGLYGFFIFTNCVCVCGIFYLAYTISRNVVVSYLAVFALVLQWQWGHALGGSAPLGVGPFPCQLATGLLLFSIAFYLRGRVLLAYALAGAIFNIHASFSIFVLTMFSVALLVGGKWRDLMKGGAIAAIAALPIGLYLFLNPLPSSGIDSSLKSTWYHLMVIRASGHLLPLHWELGKYARFLPYVLLFFLSIYCSSGERYRHARIINRKLLGLSAGIAAMCVLGLVFAEFYPIASVMRLTLFRSTRFFVILSVIITISFANSLRGKKAYYNIIFALLVAALVSGSIPMLYLVTGVLYLSRARLMRKDVMIAATIICVLSTFYGLYKYDVATINKYLNMKYFVVLCAASFIAIYLSRRELRWPRAVALVVVMAVTALFSNVHYAYEDRGYYQSARNIQLWLKDNAPRGECFIAPPLTGIWSGLSERAYYYGYIDVSFPVYADYLLPEVLRRLSDYVPDISDVHNSAELSDRMQAAYGSWDESKFKSMAQKSGCTFVIVSSEKELASKKLYSDTYFAIYDSRSF